MFLWQSVFEKFRHDEGGVLEAFSLVLALRWMACVRFAVYVHLLSVTCFCRVFIWFWNMFFSSRGVHVADQRMFCIHYVLCSFCLIEQRIWPDADEVRCRQLHGLATRLSWACRCEFVLL